MQSYLQAQDQQAIPGHIKERFYTAEVLVEHSDSNKDYHTMFYGEMVGVNIAE